MRLNENAILVARFYANSDYANLNCNEDSSNYNSNLGITLTLRQHNNMKTHKKLYEKLYSIENLLSAFAKARKGKSKKNYVVNFESNLEKNIAMLQRDLRLNKYNPSRLRKFIIRDPKTRTIHSSIFRDRIVHHAIINVIKPFYENIFIYDSFASRKNKGSHLAVKRFESFVRKASSNGQKIKNPFNNNSIRGYVLKADIKHYFATIDHEVLLNILKRKINDSELIKLIETILNSFDTNYQRKGLPLGNYTSQFFANVYLNHLDYFVKHRLKAKYYIRYVDDFIILHKDKSVLCDYKDKIEKYLKFLKLELHPEKSEIHALRNGITFLGYRIFYHYRLLRKRNIRYFKRRLSEKLELYRSEIIREKELDGFINGWMGYSSFANTHNSNKKIEEIINAKI